MSDNQRKMPQPASLGSHEIPDDRAALIREHIAMLSATALRVSDDVPYTADVTDLIRVLEQEPEA
ncbi:MAG TPA: hypothetical protein VMX97_06635 [Hyphomicrobiaceae bacterium]|nr:hypothetical protein [Hyphomicrobiaceae bacterium]